MKNLVYALVVAAAIWFGWMWLFLNFIPDKTADKWIGELRLGIDNGVLGSTFRYSPPLPEDQIILPKRGIADDFTMVRIYGPKAWDPADSHVIQYRVKFEASSVAPPGPATTSEYILIFKNSGPYILPDWQAATFLPVKIYERKLEKEARMKKAA